MIVVLLGIDGWFVYIIVYTSARYPEEMAVVNNSVMMKITMMIAIVVVVVVIV